MSAINKDSKLFREVSRSCSTCHWSHKKRHGIECRANPPTVRPDSNWGEWPLVAEKDWCGKWESRVSTIEPDPTIVGPSNGFDMFKEVGDE